MERPITEIVRRSFDAVVIIGLADGSVLDANEAFLTLTGHARHELVARPSHDFLVGLGQVADSAATEALEDLGSIANTPIGLWTRSGELRVGDLSALVLEVDGKRAALCAIRGIRHPTTAQRRTVARAELVAMVDPLALLGELTVGIGKLNRLLDDVAERGGDGSSAGAVERSPALPTGLTLKAVSRRTGVPAATLRTWQHRYGFMRPARGPSGYRLYGEEDIARIERVKYLVGQGVRVGVAMEVVIEEAQGAEDQQPISQPGHAEEGKHAEVYRFASRSLRRRPGG
jgi:DNA-binding transcriptional MerR regulator